MDDQFPKYTQELFESWINRDTWDSRHPEDEGRFLTFANIYCKEYKKYYARISVEDLIVEKWKGRRNLEKNAERYARKLDEIRNEYGLRQVPEE